MNKAINNNQAQRFGKWKTNEEFFQRKTTPVSNCIENSLEEPITIVYLKNIYSNKCPVSPSHCSGSKTSRILIFLILISWDKDKKRLWRAEKVTRENLPFKRVFQGICIRFQARDITQTTRTQAKRTWQWPDKNVEQNQSSCIKNHLGDFSSMTIDMK